MQESVFEYGFSNLSLRKSRGFYRGDIVEYDAIFIDNIHKDNKTLERK